jgi:hypothetical protein
MVAPGRLHRGCIRAVVSRGDPLKPRTQTRASRARDDRRRRASNGTEPDLAEDLECVLVRLRKKAQDRGNPRVHRCDLLESEMWTVWPSALVFLAPLSRASLDV